MKKVMIGIMIGFALSLSATAFAAPVKEFVLTKIAYPILVNGVEYNDEKLPALNYEGNTYIPLAKIGDLLGVDYRWNADKKRVEIGAEVADATDSSGSGTVANVDNPLSVTDGTGQYSGYQMLHGYEGEEDYQIYFKGNANSYFTTIEDLRGINLKEVIRWSHAGKTYKNTRSELYSFFADTSWFRNNLNGVTSYTLTSDWFMDVFGDVYLDWAAGIGYSSDASRWVEKYFVQTGQINNSSNVTLTPDAKFVPVEEKLPDGPTADEVIQSLHDLNFERMSQEEKDFSRQWIGFKELEETYEIFVVRTIDQILFRKASETIFSINDVPASLKSGEVMTGDSVRYQYFDGSAFFFKGLYFDREDLKAQGIPQ